MDTFFSIFELYNFFWASVALCAICFCWVITAAFLGYLAWLWWKGITLQGTLVGYGKKRAGDGCYFPVYEFTDQTGTTHRAWSDEGSSAYDVNSIGKPVKLTALHGDDPQVHAKGSLGTYVILIVLLILSVGGYWIADSNLHFKPIHFLGAALVAIYGFVRMGLVQGIIKAIEHPGWRLKPVSALEPPINLVPVEELRAQQKTAVASQEDQWRKTPWLVCAIIGVGLIALCAYTGKKQFYLQSLGSHATGHIVDYKSESSSGSNSQTVYYPVVRFEPPGQEAITFKDRVGSSSVKRRQGEVTVLYDSDNPKNAIIDRGIWNWIAPAALFLFGVFMLWIAKRGREARLAASAIPAAVAACFLLMLPIARGASADTELESLLYRRVYHSHLTIAEKLRPEPVLKADDFITLKEKEVADKPVKEVIDLTKTEALESFEDEVGLPTALVVDALMKGKFVAEKSLPGLHMRPPFIVMIKLKEQKPLRMEFFAGAGRMRIGGVWAVWPQTEVENCPALKELKPGIRREELEKKFTMDGGIYIPFKMERYVAKECSGRGWAVKINVSFRPAEGGGKELKAEEAIKIRPTPGDIVGENFASVLAATGVRLARFA